MKVLIVLFILGVASTMWARFEEKSCNGKFDENSPEGNRIKNL